MAVSVYYLGLVKMQQEPEGKSLDSQLATLGSHLDGKCNETTLKLGDTAVEIEETSLSVEYRHICECASHMDIVVFIVHSTEGTEAQQTACHVVRCKDEIEVRC